MLCGKIPESLHNAICMLLILMLILRSPHPISGLRLFHMGIYVDQQNVGPFIMTEIPEFYTDAGGVMDRPGQERSILLVLVLASMCRLARIPRLVAVSRFYGERD